MKHIITILIILLSNLVYSQNKGYYVTNNGETHSCLIKGYILNGNVKSFKYSTKSTGTYKSFNIKDIKEFGVKNKFKFKRFDVEVEFINNNETSLDFNFSSKLKEKTLFLKQIVDGEINLYSYYINMNPILFVSNKTNKIPVQLYFKKVKHEENKIEYICRYKHQLNFYSNNDKYIVKRTRNLRYDYRAITNLITNYNKLKDNNIWSEKVYWPKWLYIFAETGISYSKLKIPNTNKDINSTNNYSISLGIECQVKNIKNLTVIGQLSIRSLSFKIKDEYYEKIKSYSYKGYDLSIGTKYYMKLCKKSKIFCELSFQPLHLSIKPEIDIDHCISLATGYQYKDRYYCKLKYNYFDKNIIWRGNNEIIHNIEFSLGIKL